VPGQRRSQLSAAPQAAQMQSSEILQTIAEVAVALAGFSGVVAVLGQRGRGNWSSEEILQLRTLVEPSLEPLVWRLSNAALASLGLAAGAAFIARSRFASTTTGQRVLFGLALLAIGAQLLAAVGAFGRYELVFVIGLIVALVVAAYNFLLLLFPTGRAA
jgi:hypothetical protein